MLLFIIWLIHNCRRLKKNGYKSLVLKIAHSLLMLILLFGGVYGQEHLSEYDILHNGEVKGTLVLCQKTDTGRVHIKIKTEVKTRFLFEIEVKSVEEAIFENGNLIYSALYRQVNGEVKINQQLRLLGGSYRLISKENIIALPEFPIRFCILSLYCNEPVNIRRVYSDSYHQYVEIKRVDQNKYQVTLPNGNSNYYYYKDGVCIRVEVDQFYNLVFRLKR